MEKEKKIAKKVKKIAKYGVNILAIVNALLVGLDPIWGIPYCDKITATISVLMAVAGTYLLGQKAYNYYTEGE